MLPSPNKILDELYIPINLTVAIYVKYMIPTLGTRWFLRRYLDPAYGVKFEADASILCIAYFEYNVMNGFRVRYIELLVLVKSVILCRSSYKKLHTPRTESMRAALPSKREAV